MKTTHSSARARGRSRLPAVAIAAGALAAVALLAACGHDSPVSGNGGGGNPPPKNNTVTVHLSSWDDHVSSPTLETPAGVSDLTIKISGDDIATVTRTVTSPDSMVEERIEVAPGTMRRVSVEARDGGGQVIYRGLRYADLDSDGQVVGVSMVTAADTQPPDFAGVGSIKRFSDTALSLSWPSATEGGAPAHGASYLIYAATASGGQNFAAPTAATSPGEVSALLIGLASGTTYYVVVRAMDAAGNVDANNTELSAITYSSGDGIYVDVKNGADSPTCGTPGSPCKTITTALSHTSGDQPIFIAKGGYTESSGETFPLQLKPGTSLNGTATFASNGTINLGTIISSTTLPTIIGAADATLFKCVVRPHDTGSNGNPAVDGNGETMTIWFSAIDLRMAPYAVGVKMWNGEVRSSSFLGNQNQPTLTVYGDGTQVARSHFSGASAGIGLFSPARNVVVMHNVIERCQSGIFSSGILPEARDCTIFHNTITDNTGDGITLQDASGFVVESNTIMFNGQSGITAAGGADGGTVECVLNVIATNGYYGIHAGAGLGDGIDSLVAYSNVIACNTLSNLRVAPLVYADVRHNHWNHNPPTTGTDPSLTPECDPGVDICYHGSPPVPVYLPAQPPAVCGIGTPALVLPGLFVTGQSPPRIAGVVARGN